PACAQVYRCIVPASNNSTKAPSTRCGILAFGSPRSVPPAPVESPGLVLVLVPYRPIVITHHLVSAECITRQVTTGGRRHGDATCGHGVSILTTRWLAGEDLNFQINDATFGP